MRLAKAKAEGKLNPSSMSDFSSLSKAYRVLADPPEAKSKGAPATTKAGDKYDKLEEKLIDSIKKLNADEAEAAAQKTINELIQIVETKKGGKWKLKLAA
jgi:hypothetical protein